METKERSNGHNEFKIDTFGYDLESLSIEELEAIGTDEGIDWTTSRHQDGIARRREDAAMRERDMQPPRGIGKVISGIAWLGTLILMIVTAAFQYAAMPLSVLGLGVAEGMRVKQGIAMFDPDNANVLSAVLVVFAIGLLFIRAHKGIAFSGYKFSLKLAWRDLVYLTGRGKRWRVKKVTEDERLNYAARFLMWLVIWLGVVGVLQDEIATQAAGKPWLDGLRAVAFESELDTMLSMIGGGALAFGLFTGLHFVVSYNYSNYYEKYRFLSASLSEDAANEAQKKYMVYQIKRRRERNAAR